MEVMTVLVQGSTAKVIEDAFSAQWSDNFSILRFAFDPSWHDMDLTAYMKAPDGATARVPMTPLSATGRGLESRVSIPRQVMRACGDLEVAVHGHRASDDVTATTGTITVRVQQSLADGADVGASDDVLAHLEELIAAKISDAPHDGHAYARKDGEWIRAD